jgi:phospholipid/cholesterol/gamma-HCH transport system substrate-binding protein
VGSVTGISLAGDKVVATFGVRNLTLGDQSTASIEVKTVLGQHYLGLVPRGSNPLPEGGTIRLANTSTPLNIVPAFNRLASQSHEIDTDQVAESFDAMTELLDATGPDIKEMLNGLGRLSRVVSSQDAEFRQLFERTTVVTGALASRDREFGQLITSSNRVLKVLKQQRKTIDRIIAGTTALSVQLTGLVHDNEADFNAALKHLNRVLAVLRDNRKQIDQIIEIGDVYAREFVNVVGTGPWFDSTVKFPNGMALCANGGAGVVEQIVADAFAGVSGTGEACIPFGDSGALH